MNVIYGSKKIQTAQQNNHRITLELQTHKKYQLLVEAEVEDGTCEKVSFISGICKQEGHLLKEIKWIPDYICEWENRVIK